MSVDFLHDHNRLDSPVHRLPAAMKFAAALVFVLAVILLPKSQPAGLCIVAAALILVAIVSRIPLLFLLKRLLLLEPFVLGVAVLALFQPDGSRVFLILLLKTNLCLLTTILLSNTTPFAEMLRVLKRIHVPWLMVSTLTLMHRYLFVLVDESERMRRARASRTFTHGRRFHWHTLATVAGQLFIRATGRAERIYDAMCARGWK
jgi:cobalt/nickel transport system permease protein